MKKTKTIVNQDRQHDDNKQDNKAGTTVENKGKLILT